MIEIKVTFETREEAIAWLKNGDCKQTETTKETPKKAEAKKETKPKEENPEKVRKALVDKIRDFIIADKATNVKRVLGVMPQGKKDIVTLDLEEAQTICLDLGIE